MDGSREEVFADRREAGVRLASALARFGGEPGLAVLGLPRGGMPVAYEVAVALGAPLDVFVVRKLGMPGQPEFALGAIASGGVRVLNEEALGFGVTASEIDAIAARESRELERREREYRGARPPVDLRGRTVILVDDGLATGSSMRAAVRAVRARQPARIVVAVPVGAPATCRELAEVADEVVCPRTPQAFSAVGQWYRDFSQTSDEEVKALLRRSRQAGPAAG